MLYFLANVKLRHMTLPKRKRKTTVDFRQHMRLLGCSKQVAFTRERALGQNKFSTLVILSLKAFAIVSILFF